MAALESTLKKIATDAGASSCGIASLERLLNAPPSADPTYVLKSARSVVAFAVAFDEDILADFMAKKSFVPYTRHKKELSIRLFEIGDLLTEHLTGLGHEAVTVSINAVYRPEPGRGKAGALEMIPDFSHRYAAVAAGLGRIGWSGNVLTPEHGAAVEFCSVITSAELQQDGLLEDNPCDGCRSCVSVCPVSMIKHHEAKTVSMFGLEDRIAQKRANMVCYSGCGDYHGTSPDGKFSNWSPYRFAGGLPDDDREVEKLGNQSRANDPHTDGVYQDFRSYIMDPDKIIESNCGFCAYVCNGPSPKRNRARQSILKGGCVVLRVNGRRESWVEHDDIVEVANQAGEMVAMLKQDIAAVERGELEVTPDATDNLRDSLFLQYFKELKSV